MDPTDPKWPPAPEDQPWPPDIPDPPEPDEPEPADYDPDEVEDWPADPKTEEAKTALMELFANDPPQVYYQRQLEVIFERDFFHWVTVRALRELVEERKIRTQRLGAGTPGLEAMCFYWPRRLRYHTRQMISLGEFVETELLQQNFNHALGRQAELLFDAGLATASFTTAGKNVREWNGVRWTRTGHDLDRVYARDGIAYGAEMKNRLAYISREEMETKLAMCAALGLTPLFIMRFAPKDYIEQIRQAGGFAWIFEYQLYPFGTEEKVKRVRERLGIKVDCPSALWEGTIRRFVRWHERRLGR